MNKLIVIILLLGFLGPDALIVAQREDKHSSSRQLEENLELLIKEEIVKRTEHLQNELNKNLKLVNALQAEVTSLREDAVPPIGFIYTEYPGEAAPQDLWPVQTWTEVSGNFAGNFFRVVGGNAGSFGQVQGSSSGGALEAKNYYTSCFFGTCEQYSDTVNLTNSDPSAFPAQRTRQLLTGSQVEDGEQVHVDFLVSTEETRPVNMAVRIWKRTA